jgi:hypothetical protein
VFFTFRHAGKDSNRLAGPADHEDKPGVQDESPPLYQTPFSHFFGSKKSPARMGEAF